MPEAALCFAPPAMQNSSLNLLFLTNEMALALGIIAVVEWIILLWYMFKRTPEWAEQWFPA